MPPVKRHCKTEAVSNTLPILIVDDSKDDRYLLMRALRKAGVQNPIAEVSSGAEAIRYLAGEGAYSDREKHPEPAIAVIDLDMPEVDGFGVLQWIRDKYTGEKMLVIVLSRLEEVKHLNRAYALGANSFLTKPGSEKELDELVKSFAEYWIIQNEGPSSGRGNDRNRSS